MKAVAVLATAALVAGVPASLGLIGNAEFSQAVPVRLPAAARILDEDSRPTRAPVVQEVGDDRGDRSDDRDDGRDRDADPGEGRARGAARPGPGNNSGGDSRRGADETGEDRDRSAGISHDRVGGDDAGHGGGEGDRSDDDRSDDDRSGHGSGDDDRGDDDRSGHGGGDDDRGDDDRSGRGSGDG